MDPKKVDLVGRGFRAALAAGFLFAAKKYGPKVIEYLKKAILKK